MLPALLQTLARQGWGGLECLTGIPGTVGGAVLMNAGTETGTISDHLAAVTLMDREGHLQRREAESLDFGYRRAGLPEDHVIVEAEFLLEKGEPHKIQKAIRNRWNERKAKQPLLLPSAGCVFQNPPGDAAGRMIDACGLKGNSVGGAEVSPIHANFIVNRGHARAADVMELIRRVREKVRDRFGVTLDLEIRLLGAFPDGTFEV